MCLILIILTWYESWFYETRLNPEHSFRGSNCNYFVSASAKFGISSISTIILVFCLPFSFCNLVFAFNSCKFVFCFGVIVWFWKDICLVSVISVQFQQFGIFFRYFCIMILCDCWLWLLKDMIHFSLWVWGWMERTIRIGAM